jgi:hypothetical protein
MSFHDEPMVVENGPLGIDVGEEHAQPGNLVASGNDWLRFESQLSSIIVVRKKPGSDSSEEFVHFHLDKAQPIQLTLADPPGPAPATGSLSLIFEGPERKTLRIKPNAFTFTRGSRRLQQAGQLRMLKIQFHALVGDPVVSEPQEVVLRNSAADPVEFGTVFAVLH